MVGRKRGAPQGRSQKRTRGASNDGPDIYEAMLAEAGVAGPAGPQTSASTERPLKRRRPGTRNSDLKVLASGADAGSSPGEGPSSRNVDSVGDQASDDEEDVEFEDVEIPAPSVQTLERDSDSEEGSDEEDDVQFEDVDLTAPPETLASPDEAPGSEGARELELNLTAHKSATTPARHAAGRRRPMTREGRERRAHVHRAHLLCLLSHVARRNYWCNDGRVQDALRPHLTEKMVQYLTPGTHLTQFGRTESLKNGLKLAMDMWRMKFEIRERGLRRSLWVEDVELLKDYELPKDMDSCIDREDFRDAARKLQGSRDVGAQLFVALLRSVGVRARLVCSLQPLLFVSGGPSLRIPKSQEKDIMVPKTSRNEQVLAQIAKHREILESQDQSSSASSSGAGSSSRRRLGHPNAAARRFEPMAAPPKREATFEAPRRIRESPHPVYWVEVLDVGHQKWQPVDPVVTHTFWKPRVLEPPLTDPENCLSHVVAFDGDGAAKDVTRRYAKAYTAKTLRLRAEKGTEDGDKWWQRVMALYRHSVPSDLDQIEDIELTGSEAREPMPRNVQDFKNHPVYALERHLRRHEVLAPGATPSGTVNTGSRTPLEKVYRRKDVRIAKSSEKWFRLGREIKPLQIPVKWLPKRARSGRAFVPDEAGDTGGDAAGTPLYTHDQTELYEPPPVRRGRVPKNKFGNIEVYTPSMVPRGGSHVVHERAIRAACILGVDYAPALTDFQFTGRHGTAVLSGVVVAEEHAEAVRAVVRGLDDLAQEVEDEMRQMVALKLWRRFLMGLRIRERIWSGVGDEERAEADRRAAGDDGADEQGESEDTEEIDMIEDDEGGGFLVD